MGRTGVRCRRGARSARTAFAAAVAVAGLAGTSLAAQAAAPPLASVTLIGDSVAGSVLYVPDARSLIGKGVRLDLEVAACRRIETPSCAVDGRAPQNVLALVPRLGRRLGAVAVMAIGYNDFPHGYRKAVADAMAALRRAGVRRVVWLTLRESRAHYPAMNAALRSYAVARTGVVIADWNAYSWAHPEWFLPDGLHLTVPGALAFAGFVHDTLVAHGIALPDHGESDG